MSGPAQPRRYWEGMRPPSIIPASIMMAGGLDVMTPPFQMKPGLCRVAQNFECSIFGGYRRIGGYEAYDGQAAPSSMAYWILPATITGSPVVGNTLHGSTSGATGVVIALPGGQFVLTLVVGTFQAGENLNVGAGTIAVASTAAILRGASSVKLDAQYLALAANQQRANITTVPGSGPVLGVVLYNDTVYAFRNNAGASASVLFKSTGSGWSQVPLGRQLQFSTGSAAIAEGATITGATSGASAVLKRVSLESGTYAGSTAAGHFIFASVVGGPFMDGENLQVSTVTKAVAVGADAAIALAPGGRYEFAISNFSGSTATKRIYGCDGVNKAFEFDGTIYVPITTGMVDDAPTHIAAHLYHLFLSFDGSVQFSSAGFPYQWSPVVGAGELAMGDSITGFAVQASASTTAALAVFTTGRLSVLYGTGATSFQLLPYRDEIGSSPYTAQNLAQTVFLDLRGITDITTTQAYGNFIYAVIANQVKSLLTSWRSLATASCVSRDLAQYRLFFSNGYAFYLTMIERKVVGIMPVLFPDIVRCAFTDKFSDGSEGMFFGTDGGYVMQMDMGTSFNGRAIEAYVNLAYNFEHGPRTLKTFRGGALEVIGSSYCEFRAGYSLGYGDPSIIQPMDTLLSKSFSSAFWDAVNWDSFTWDGSTLGPSTMEIGGDAENISLSIYSNDDYFQPFSVTGGVINYTPRRELR